jgi:folate-binding protein YgfZ
MTPIEAATDTVAREYEAARKGATFCTVEDRALLVVTGPLRQKFLQGMLSHDVLARVPGQGCRAALMDVKGHLLTFARALVTESDVRLELPAARRAMVEQLLMHYRVAAPVRFAASDEQVLALLGPRVLEHLRTLVSDLPTLEPESHVRITIGGAEVRLARAGDMPAAGCVIHVARDNAEAVRRALESAGFMPLGRAALDALRVEDGRAWYGLDVTEANLLHETGLVAEYHSPTKGCYVGQEVIARLEARGANVNQRLRGLRLSEPRTAGTTLRADDKEAGVLTTGAISPRHGAIAMAYVRRGHDAPGTILDAAGARAEVVALPMGS